MEYIAERLDLDDPAWYKDGPFWRRPNHDGSNGKGDLIFNTCAKIVHDQDTSDWAKWALQECYKLLMQRKRWPDYMVHPMDTHSLGHRIINRWRRRLFKNYSLPYRWQGRMSRDPYTAFATACLVVGEEYYLETIKLPWNIYSPAFWNWWKFLLTQERKYEVRMMVLDHPSKHDYVIKLEELRELAVLLIKSRNFVSYFNR